MGVPPLLLNDEKRQHGEGLNDVQTVPGNESYGFPLGLEPTSNGMLFYPAVDLEPFHCRSAAWYPRTVPQNQLSSFLRREKPLPPLRATAPDQGLPAWLSGYCRDRCGHPCSKSCNVKAQSPIEKASRQSENVVRGADKAPWTLLRPSSPHKLWLFIRREAQDRTWTNDQCAKNQAFLVGEQVPVFRSRLFGRRVSTA